MDHHGIWSVIPPLLAIGLAFATRQVLFSLFVSIWVGAMILTHGNPVTALATMIVDYIAGPIADPWNAAIIVINIVLGGTIGLISRAGGAKAVADGVGRLARTPRSGQFAAYLLGIAIFFDDYANTLIVGNTMRPLSDRLRISREKLAYICDSTAAPVASMAVLSTWTAYEMGLIRTALVTIGVDTNVYSVFIRTIPYRFYGILALVFVALVVFMRRDFGPMLHAERRARSTGKVLADGARPLMSSELTDMCIKEGVPHRWYNAAVPIGVIIVTLVVGLFIDGRAAILAGDDSALADLVRTSPWSFRALGEIFGMAEVSHAFMWAVVTGMLTAMTMVLSQRVLTLEEALGAWTDGARAMFFALLILTLAWGIGGLCRDLGTATYLVGLLEGRMTPVLIPPVVFLLGCVIAFSTGTAYGTTAILIPIAVPLAYHLGGGFGGVMYATIGATFTGAVFGDHCSPISDTTILSSTATASDHLDHVRTQMPYAVTVAVIAILTCFIPAASGVNPFILIFIGGALCYLVLRFAGRAVEP